MGQLLKGAWRAEDRVPQDRSGHFVRAETQFRNWVTASGEPGPTGIGGFKAEPGRYHLIVSLACPWAHRTLIFRRLKGLETMISLSVVHWLLRERGWTFEEGEGVIPDPIFGAKELRQFYVKARPDYSGRVTVPVLWDRKTNTIVNNESSEIIRMLNSEFEGIAGDGADFYPKPMRTEIDRLNETIYANVNNGVYRCGFAKSQAAYEASYDALFATLDELDARLSRQRYLLGRTITEADWRLFPTLVRFDVAYFSLFRCNKKRIADYPNLANYMRELYQMPGVAETVKARYYVINYWSIARLNPLGIIPKGTPVDYSGPHDRARLAS